MAAGAAPPAAAYEPHVAAARDLVSGKSVLLVGVAGTGKMVVLSMFLDWLKSHNVACEFLRRDATAAPTTAVLGALVAPIIASDDVELGEPLLLLIRSAGGRQGVAA